MLVIVKKGEVHVNRVVRTRRLSRSDKLLLACQCSPLNEVMGPKFAGLEAAGQ
jgi:hypothetical protein